MREMKQSGIEWLGEIPKQWKVYRNSNAFNLSKKVVGDKWSSTQLLSLTTKGVRKKNIEMGGGKQPASFEGYQFVQLNDLIMCLFDLDCSAVFSGISPYSGMITSAYNILKCKKCINPSFADYWFQNISSDRKFMWEAKNLRYTLSYENFKVLPVVIPPIPEQIAIANYLDDKCGKIDDLIENEEKVIAELKEYKKSIIQKAVTKGIIECELKDSCIEYFGKIPNNWEIVRNKNIFRIKKEIVGEKFTDYQLLSLTQQGVVEKDIDAMDGNLPESFETYQRVPLNTIVIALFDISTRSTTISGWAKNEGMITSAYRVLIPNGKVNLAYYDYLFTHIGADRCYVAEGKNIRCSIDEETFGSIKIICPPLLEQEAIAEYLNKKMNYIDQLIAIKQQKIVELKEYKKSLIYECVTGKREVV